MSPFNPYPHFIKSVEALQGPYGINLFFLTIRL